MKFTKSQWNHVYNDIEMNSTNNEEKSAVAEVFIRPFKNKVHKKL